MDAFLLLAAVAGMIPQVVTPEAVVSPSAGVEELHQEARPSDIQFQFGGFRVTLLELPAFRRVLATVQANGPVQFYPLYASGVDENLLARLDPSTGWGALLAGSGPFPDSFDAAPENTRTPGQQRSAAKLTGDAGLFTSSAGGVALVTESQKRWLEGSDLDTGVGWQGGLWLFVILLALLLSQLRGTEKEESRRDGSERHTSPRHPPRSSSRRRH